jgi:hypothetical protein
LVHGNNVGDKAVATTTDSFTVPVGESIYTVKADLSSDFTANDTIQVGIETGAITAKGDITARSYTVSASELMPGTNVQSTTLTIKAATLQVSVGTTPATQTVVAGAQDFAVASFILSAVNSGTDVEVTSLKPRFLGTGNAYPSLLSGWTLWDGNTQIGINSESTTCGGATCSTAATAATTTLTLNDNALIIGAGTSKTVTLKADIGTGATSGTFSVGMYSNSNASVSAVDSEAQAITPSITSGDGQSMTLSAGGTLLVSISTTQPKAANYAANSTVEIGRFSAQAKQEGMGVNYLGFTVAAPSGGIVGNYEDLTMLSVWDGSTKLGEVALSSANATITPTNMNLAVNEDKTYVVKATFPSVASPSSAASGEGFKLSLTNIDVDGTSAGSSSVTVSGLGTAFNDAAIFKSQPTVTKIDFTGDNEIVAGVVNLYKFSVAADGAGPVGLYRLTFGVATSTVTLSQSGYYLYESSSSNSLGDIVAQGSDFVFVSGGDATAVLPQAYFDIGNDNSNAPAKEHDIIPAGTTRYYTLRGTIASGHDNSAQDEAITTVMAGDASYNSASVQDADGLIAAADQNDFIWSDLNFDSYSSSTATTTTGWFNGFRVPGLDTTSSTGQTITN